VFLAAEFREARASCGPSGAAAQLLRLHRHSLINLLVCGGSAEERRSVGFEFHRASPLRTGPFVAIDCRHDGARVHASLESWLARTSRSPRDNPLRAAARGTMFLDSIEALSAATQRLLLLFADGSARPDRDDEGVDWAGRLIVGSVEDLLVAVADGRFLAALQDHLDKIRVDLEPARHEGAA